MTCAIGRRLDKDDFAQGEIGQQLAKTYDVAQFASQHVTTDGSTVEALRRQLCATCRGNVLYECDRAQGWSENCAFLKKNGDWP